MIEDKVVVRYKDKTLMKGRTGDFSPDKTYFHLRLLNGEMKKVDMEKLKAVFVVKSYAGNRNYKYTYNDFLPWEGNKVKISFMDGEVMIGYTPSYSHGKGFFITPADLKGNNKSVFVVASSIQEITFL